MNYTYRFELENHLTVGRDKTTIRKDFLAIDKYIQTIGAENILEGKIFINKNTCALTFILNRKLSWLEESGLTIILNREMLRAKYTNIPANRGNNYYRQYYF